MIESRPLGISYRDSTPLSAIFTSGLAYVAILEVMEEPHPHVPILLRIQHLVKAADFVDARTQMKYAVHWKLITNQQIGQLKVARVDDATFDYRLPLTVVMQGLAAIACRP